MKKNFLFKMMLVSVFSFFVFNNMQAQCDKDTPSHSEEKHATINTSDGGETSFFVDGHCNNCKAKIEEAALSIKGVKTAEWTLDTKQLKLDVEEGTDIKQVHKAIAAAGYSLSATKSEMHKDKAHSEECNKEKTKKHKKSSCND
ncbi:MAG: heavy-metal-associated domain-containing protein [Bacteroidales bacterium]|nr:heavy-metal-associated domain-containing protein [Bacteroidales bacterium]